MADHRPVLGVVVEVGVVAVAVPEHKVVRLVDVLDTAGVNIAVLVDDDAARAPVVRCWPRDAAGEAVETGADDMGDEDVDVLVAVGPRPLVEQVPRLVLGGDDLEAANAVAWNAATVEVEGQVATFVDRSHHACR